MNDNREMIDDILDVMLKKVVPIASEIAGNSIPEPEEKVEFSEEHKKKMQQLFKKARKKQLQSAIMKQLPKVAVLVLVTLLATGVLIYSVDAWRIKFLNMVLEMNDNGTQISFVDGTVEGNSYIHANLSSKFSWLNSDNINRVILKNSSNSTIDLTYNKVYNLLFDRSGGLFSLLTNKIGGIKTADIDTTNFSLITLRMNPYYKLEFSTDDFKTYTIEIYDELISFNNELYKCNLLTVLANACMPVTDYLQSEENNLFYAMKNSFMVISRDILYGREYELDYLDKFIQLPDFINNYMTPINSLPSNQITTLHKEYTAYRYGNEIIVNVYDYDGYGANIVEIKHDDISYYYEQQENRCKIDGTPSDNPSIYKLWGAG